MIGRTVVWAELKRRVWGGTNVESSYAPLRSATVHGTAGRSTLPVRASAHRTAAAARRNERRKPVWPRIGRFLFGKSERGQRESLLSFIGADLVSTRQASVKLGVE